MPIIFAAMLMTNRGSSSDRVLSFTTRSSLERACGSAHGSRASPRAGRNVSAHPEPVEGCAESDGSRRYLRLPALLAQPLEQLALAVRERLRQDNAHAHQEVAPRLVLPFLVQTRHAQAGEAEHAAVLGERRNLEGDLLAG